MNKKIKIFLYFIIGLLLLSALSANKVIESISYFGAILLVIAINIAQSISTSKLIKQLKIQSLNYIEVKESNKWNIVLFLIMIFNLNTAIKSKYRIIQAEKNLINVDLTTYINSFDSHEKLLIICCVILALLAVLKIIQILLNSTIVTEDKVIFYDGLIFDIDDIDSIEYANLSKSKNTYKIKLGKGFIDRKIIVSSENFSKVKSMLDKKNA